MLEGDELEKAIANIMKRLRSVNLLYIRKVAMQIRKIGELGQSSINRLIAMTEMNADIGEIKDRLRTVSAVNARELQGIFTRAMNETYTDPRFRRYLAKYPLENAQRQRIERYVQTVYRQTAANMYNYSNTTAITQGYMDAIDKAVLAVSTGVASYTEAMRDTVRELGASGMKVVYESGYRRRLDTAVRQNIVDAVNQINKNASLMLGEELGYDAVEISAHAMSAPDHEPVQGHVFLLAEFQQMQAGSPFRDIDGNVFAGFRRPIGEWNCRHTPLSFSTKYSKRKWTDEQLRQFIEENKAGCEIGGKHKTLYEATQMMREIETAVRREKDTAVAAQAAGDTVLRQECQRNINALVRRYAAVSAASGAAERRKRMTVEGFRAVKVPKDSESGISGKYETATDENRVDISLLKTEAYKAKFRGITGNTVVDQQIYRQAVAQLTHRNGTYKEDMTLIDSRTGKIAGRQSSSQSEFGVDYNSSLRKAIAGNPPQTLISVHNHPTNNPPTGADFVSNGRHAYKLGVVVTHHGRVYIYKAGNRPFTEDYFSQTVDKKRGMGYNEVEAIELTLQDFVRDYGIEWSER